MQNHLNYKNCKIHFTKQGKGRAVVLLHGFLENSTMWQNLAVHLSKKYRVICIDLLGHGQTDSLGYVHTMEDQAAVVKAVLNYLRFRKVILTGHSMGGYVALAFAKNYPKNIKGLCLLNSTPLADSKTKKQDRNRAIDLVKQNHKLFIKTAIPNLFSDTNRLVYKTEIQTILNEALRVSKQGIIAALEGMKQRKDLTPVLQNKNLNSLLFIGEADTPDKTTLFLKAINSDSNKATIVRLRGKHMGFIESKDEVLKELSRFCQLRFK